MESCLADKERIFSRLLTYVDNTFTMDMYDRSSRAFIRRANAKTKKVEKCLQSS